MTATAPDEGWPVYSCEQGHMWSRNLGMECAECVGGPAQEVMGGELATPQRRQRTHEVAWLIHDVASLGKDEPATSFDDMADVYYGILMATAEKIVDLLAPSDPVEPMLKPLPDGKFRDLSHSYAEESVEPDFSYPPEGEPVATVTLYPDVGGRAFDINWTQASDAMEPGHHKLYAHPPDGEGARKALEAADGWFAAFPHYDDHCSPFTRSSADVVHRVLLATLAFQAPAHRRKK